MNCFACLETFGHGWKGMVKGMTFENATVKTVRVALLAALALALGVLEGVFTPILPPGVKAGISNIAVMLAAAHMGLCPALAIVFAKAVFALVTRGVIAFGMSFCGGMLSALLLWILFRFAKEHIGILGISMLGAFTHNLAQGVFALCVFGSAILAYLPILVLLSVPCGLVSGAATAAIRKMKRV